MARCVQGETIVAENSGTTNAAYGSGDEVAIAIGELAVEIALVRERRT
jgi:hypothetical protein